MSQCVRLSFERRVPWPMGCDYDANLSRPSLVGGGWGLGLHYDWLRLRDWRVSFPTGVGGRDTCAVPGGNRSRVAGEAWAAVDMFQGVDGEAGRAGSRFAGAGLHPCGGQGPGDLRNLLDGALSGPLGARARPGNGGGPTSLEATYRAGSVRPSRVLGSSVAPAPTIFKGGDLG